MTFKWQAHVPKTTPVPLVKLFQEVREEKNENNHLRRILTNAIIDNRQGILRLRTKTMGKQKKDNENC